MVNKIKTLGRGIAIAEEQRDKTPLEGFMADLFRGRVSFENMFPWPEQPETDLEKEKIMMECVRKFLVDEIDPEKIERRADISFETIVRMSDLGLFALKIPEENGGKGLSQTSYIKLVGLLSSYSSPLAILVSAHNTIGGIFPVLYFGTEEQKLTYLPKLMRWPSGFCFTEKNVGSDPARMKTYALREYRNGKLVGYRLCGQKWYTTNAPLTDRKALAEYLVVIAKIVNDAKEVTDSTCFGCFIIPTNSPGLTIGPKNEFCGMRGIYNANPKFENIFASPRQLIGGEGAGFRIASQALNTGRIAIAGGCLASAKQALAISSWWANERKQWGGSIGEKELIGSGKLAIGLADAFAIEAITFYAASLVDREGKDPRLEAAVAKIIASEQSWKIIDDMMQIFGGRGYEKVASLAPRETALPVERIFRDARPTRIFEGSTEILSQWILREGLADYLERGKVFFEEAAWWKKLFASFHFLSLYIRSFKPTHSSWPKESIPKELRTHLKFIQVYTGKLVRVIIRLSKRYRAALMVKQLTTYRLFCIVARLTAMAVSCSYALYLYRIGKRESTELADLFCRQARKEIVRLFEDLWDNNDKLARRVAKNLLAGRHDRFIYKGIVRITAQSAEDENSIAK